MYFIPNIPPKVPHTPIRLTITYIMSNVSLILGQINIFEQERETNRCIIGIYWWLVCVQNCNHVRVQVMSANEINNCTNTHQDSKGFECSFPKQFLYGLSSSLRSRGMCTFDFSFFTVITCAGILFVPFHRIKFILNFTLWHPTTQIAQCLWCLFIFMLWQ